MTGYKSMFNVTMALFMLQVAQKFCETESMLNESILSQTMRQNATLPSNTGHEYISAEALENTKFVLGMILIPFFAFFGSIGNIFSLIVICHQTVVQRMRNSTNICLAALTISDMLFLFHCLLFAGINVHIHFEPFEGNNIRAMMFPVFGAYGSIVTARITTLMTLLLSIERFIAVYLPMKAKVMCNQTVTIIAVSGIYLITALLFVPYIFKYKVKYIATKSNCSKALVIPSEFGRNTDFFYIYGIVTNVFFRFLPIFLLIVMNIFILHVINKTWRKRKAISNIKSSSSGVNEQHHITIMLLTVSFVFLICILPGAINSILTHTLPEYNRAGKKRNLLEFVNYITYFLETVNSSTNFIIYMALSKRFCNTYKRIFCCQKHRSFRSLSGRSKLSFSHDRTASYNKEHDHLIRQSNCGSVISLETRYTAIYNPRRNSNDPACKFKSKSGFKRTRSQTGTVQICSSLENSPNSERLSICDNENDVRIPNKMLTKAQNGKHYSSEIQRYKSQSCESCEYKLKCSQNGHCSAEQEDQYRTVKNGIRCTNGNF